MDGRRLDEHGRLPEWRPSVTQLILSIAFATMWVCLVVVLIGIFDGTVPTWMSAVAVAAVVATVGRAPFVGVRIVGSSLVRRTWLYRRRSHPVETVLGVRVGPYGGWLAPWNSWGPTPTATVFVELTDGASLELRELYGWASRMHVVANGMNHALGHPVANLEPRHRVCPRA